MLDRLHSYLFFGLLTVWGALIFVMPKAEESATENRRLSSLPELSWQSYLNAGIADSLDTYVSDHIPFRDKFVALSFWLKEHRGFRSDEFGVFDGVIDMDAGIAEIEEEKSEENRDSLFFNDGNAADVGQLGKLLIYNGKAIQRFGGENTTQYGKSTVFNAQVTNEIYDSLRATTRVFVAITPSSGEITLPSAYKAELSKRRGECANIDSINSYLRPQVVRVDICSELHRHKNEYLYFGTDHHWTGRAAYYGYVAWCRAAGIAPVPLDSLERKVIHGFLGTLYNLTRDQRLAANPDSVEYFKVRVKHRAFALSGSRCEQKTEKRMYAEIASGVNSYGVFLGRDHPVMCIETDVKNGKVVLITKNSYGNPFVTYLASHFERIFVVDYRKFKHNLIDFCRKHKVTDYIAFQNTFSANTSSHTEMIRKLIHSPLKADFFPRDPDLFNPQAAATKDQKTKAKN